MFDLFLFLSFFFFFFSFSFCRYREQINRFKRTMPLIQDLKNEAMRPRHWQQLVAHVGGDFDPQSEDFTLGRMIDAGLDRYAEAISEISTAASKELSIEQSIATIANAWAAMQLDIAPFKDRGHFILRGTDEVFQLLEDNQVTLSTMKASRYVKVRAIFPLLAPSPSLSFMYVCTYARTPACKIENNIIFFIIFVFVVVVLFVVIVVGL